MRIKNKEIEDLPAFIKAKELASFLGISSNSMFKILHKNDCPKITVGNKYLIPTKKFLNWFVDSGSI